MTYAAIPSYGHARLDHRRPRRRAPVRALGAVTLALGTLTGALVLDAGSTAGPGADGAPRVAPRAAAPVPNRYLPLLDAAYALGPVPASFERSAPLGSELRWATPSTPAVPTVPEPEPEMVTAVPVPIPAPVIPELVQDPPLPTPRPPDLQARASRGGVRAPGRPFAQRNGSGAIPTAAPDDRTFLQRFFGLGRPSESVLAYATPEEGVLGGAPNLGSGSMMPFDRWTAVYDIAAHTVTLPNGTKLEAHSGLGALLDDPRHVSARNRGATPPHVYDLQPREQLFHGVRALRLNPVGGGGVFGRTGLLAHTYMLGPNGDSNGCVSFRNYDAFLRAYQNGEIKRLVVVARGI